MLLSYSTLFILEWIAGLHPGTPAPFEGKYLLITVAFEELCHPGTGSFILSGTVKYEGLILDVFFAPLLHPGGVLSDGRWDFLAAPPPVTMLAHVYDLRVRPAQHFFDLVNRNPGDLTIFISQANDRLAAKQQKYDPPPSTPGQ
jgi:hypothetical protein